MVTERYKRECPVNGCEYKNHMEGKFASLDDVFNHVAAEHKIDQMIAKDDWKVVCEIKGCHETLRHKSFLTLFEMFVKHINQGHADWIDPALCKTCADRRMDDMNRELHTERYNKDGSAVNKESHTDKRYPKNSSDAELLEKVSDKEYYPEHLLKRNIHTLTESEYRELMLWYNGCLPPGPEGERLIKARKVVTNFDYYGDKPWPEIE